MSDKTPLSREHLLALEPEDPALRAEYERRLRAMFETELTGYRKWAWRVAPLFYLGVCVSFALRAWHPGRLPPIGRVGFAVAAVLSAAAAVAAARVAVRGTLRRRADVRAVTQVSLLFMVFGATIFLYATPQMGDLPHMLQGLGCVVVFLVGGVAFLIQHLIEQSELNTREQILQLEYKVAQLSERLT